MIFYYLFDRILFEYSLLFILLFDLYDHITFDLERQ